MSSFWRFAKSWKRVSPNSLTKFYALNRRTFFFCGKLFAASQPLQFLLLWRLLVLWRSQKVKPCAVSCIESIKRKKLVATEILLNTCPKSLEKAIINLQNITIFHPLLRIQMGKEAIKAVNLLDIPYLHAGSRDWWLNIEISKTYHERHFHAETSFISFFHNAYKLFNDDCIDKVWWKSEININILCEHLTLSTYLHWKNGTEIWLFQIFHRLKCSRAFCKKDLIWGGEMRYDTKLNLV